MHKILGFLSCDVTVDRLRGVCYTFLRLRMEGWRMELETRLAELTASADANAENEDAEFSEFFFELLSELRY